MSKNNELLIIGLLPETAGVGGVSIHLQRLCDYLDEKDEINYTFYDYRKNGYMSLIRIIGRYELVHAHFSNSYLQFFMALLCKLRGVKSIMTLHGNYFFRKGVDRNLTYLAIKTSSYPIIINKQSYERCKKINKNSILMPSFIPPIKGEELDHEIEHLVEHYHKKGKIIVSTNAYRMNFDKEGHEVYGIGFLVNYFKDKEEYLLLVSDPSGMYSDKYVNVENVEFISYPHSYYELLKIVDLFVRNTSSDGDSLSVKESLCLNLPTICTDVVDRPEGVVPFHYSDEKSFEDALNIVKSRKDEEIPTISNAAEELLILYRQLLK